MIKYPPSANCNSRNYEIYPKRYFDSSQTWFAWNKLTAADIYALREEKGFEGQNIYFHLNHPIQYVRLVGIVVCIETVANERFALLTLDDGSGANIELKIERRRQQQQQQVTGNQDDDCHPSNTLIDSVDVHVALGETKVRLNSQPLSLGAVIMARGSITTFARQRQILLKRVARVEDTNAEAVHWSEAAAWKRNTLSRPWILTERERRDIDDEISRAESKDRERERKKRKWEMRRRDKEVRREEKRTTEEKKFNVDAIQGSNVLPEFGFRLWAMT